MVFCSALWKVKLKLMSQRHCSLPFAAATVCQDHHQPHEDVQCVHVNPHTPVRLPGIKHPHLGASACSGDKKWKIVCEPFGIKCFCWSDLRVDGVVFLYTVDWVCLCSLDDLLCIIEQEHAEQHQASVDGHGVEPCSKRWGGRQEHRPWEKQHFIKRPSTDS